MDAAGTEDADPELSLDEVFASSQHDNNDGGTKATTVHRGSWGYASMERMLDLNMNLDFGRQEGRMEDMLQSVLEGTTADTASAGRSGDPDSSNEALEMRKENRDARYQFQSVLIPVREEKDGDESGSVSNIEIDSIGSASIASAPPNSRKNKRIPKRFRKLPQRREELYAMVDLLDNDLATALGDVAEMEAQMKRTKLEMKQHRQEDWELFSTGARAQLASYHPGSNEAGEEQSVTDVSVEEDISSEKIDSLPKTAKKNKKKNRNANNSVGGSADSASNCIIVQPFFDWKQWKRDCAKERLKNVRQRRRRLQKAAAPVLVEAPPPPILPNATFDWNKWRDEQHRVKSLSMAVEALSNPLALFSS